MALRRFFDRYLVLLTLIPVLAVMIAIFGFSSQNGEESGSLSAKVTEAVIRIVYPGYGLLGESEQEVLFERTAHIVRKAAHFTEFAALGFFLLGHFRALALKTSLRHPVPGAFATGFLYAVSDEFHQGFVGGRSPGVLDVGIDSAGVLFGILLMALILHLFRRGKAKPEKNKE